ncbi:hypothetical protein [Streptomyces sp. STCH 565 A]|uniref:hypothetical protein n=1 Tax=Streptomyces sp. STCH 565 A TaxID=2950532 RepID=UPI002076447E|nr:hypothetical protein [Streptomyces sp. STCH 565 A]MCM8552266.1 hypothetical protein [Streptomyces sp. STCH 565 A]
MTEQPRRFHLQRLTDVIGATGTGRVADGILWPDGSATVHWRGQDNSDVFWPTGMDGIRRRSCHDGATHIVWDDPEPAPAGHCPHCPDGHTPADRGSQPWGAWVGPEVDGDGQPMTIHVARVAGAHVAESDADWIRARLNPAEEPRQPQPRPYTGRLGRGA